VSVMSKDHVLAIDCGTQSVRALIFDPRGDLVHKVRVPIEPYVSKEPGWAEQRPAYFWENLCAACQQLWQESPIPKDALAGVALTTQRATMVNVDRQGEPLRPAIVWLDQRRTEGLPPVGGLWGLAFRLGGMTDTVAYLQAEAEVNWVRTSQPEIWERTHKYLFLSGYLTHRLVGRFVDSVGCQVGYVPFDYYRGYWMVSWFRQEFGLREEQLACERGCAPEELFDELVEAVPPGSMGLTLQPYWSPGLKSPGPEAKGAIIGFGDVHTRAHIYRAIIEGLAYALREGLERTQKRLRVRATEVRVSGGGSQSDAAMQVTADVFNLPASRPHVYETSGLGAAMDAAVGLGLHPDFETAVAEMTRVSRTFEPRPEVRDVYEGLYQRVYKQMYRRLRPLYEEIRRITGYPPR